MTATVNSVNSPRPSTRCSAPERTGSSGHPFAHPARTPYVERWIGSIRRECLDRLLILNHRHLEQVLPAYIRHYNVHRPTAHSTSDRQTPAGASPDPLPTLTAYDAETSSGRSTSTRRPRDQPEFGFRHPQFLPEHPAGATVVAARRSNASAGATITGVSGQTFTSASFTLANATQCQGGSPRFNVVTNVTTFFLGCNNVTPTLNADGTAT
jgi:hypothetical protein